MQKTKNKLLTSLMLVAMTMMLSHSVYALETGSGTAGFLDSMNSMTTTTGLDLLAPTHAAANTPTVETKLSVFNVTQQKDAAQGGNKPGDQIKITASVKNMGPGDLTAYVAQIAAENLFKVSQMIDAGTGAAVRGGKIAVFSPFNQSADCNCTEDLYFTLQLNQSLCTDFPDLAASGLVATFDNKTQTVPVVCEAEAKVETQAVETAQKTNAPKAPVTKTGPEEALLLFAAVSALAAYMFRKKILL